MTNFNNHKFKDIWRPKLFQKKLYQLCNTGEINVAKNIYI